MLVADAEGIRIKASKQMRMPREISSMLNDICRLNKYPLKLPSRDIVAKDKKSKST